MGDFGRTPRTEDTIKKLKSKVTQANELAEAISKVADELTALTEQR